MKTKVVRRVLTLAVMVMALAAIEFTSQPTQAFGCQKFCADAGNACMSECNNVPACVDQCRAEFDLCNCMCVSSICY